jgi:hypothetical protein
MSESTAPYRGFFDRLLEEEGHERIEDCLTVRVFDEIPLFSREAQLDFLQDLTITEINKLTIRAAVLHQLKIDEAAKARFPGSNDPFLRMVSVTGWWDADGVEFRSVDGNSSLLTPNFWIGNMTSPEMMQFKMDDAESEGSGFVAAAVEGIDGLRFFDGWSQGPEPRLLRRVYVSSESRHLPSPPNPRG